MAEKVRWGVIGSGGIARRRTIPEGIAPSSNGELAAVYDVNERANREVADQYGAYAASELDDLLESGIDAVYVASPAHLHRTHVMRSAGAGKHVLCEKPLGLSVEEAERMILICGDAGVILGTALMMRYHAQHREAARMIEDGAIGRPVYARTQLSCWYPPIADAWRQDPARGGGGSLIDLGGHCIDLLEMFFGPVVQLCCFTGNVVHSYASEDGAAAILRFESGAMGSVDAFFCVPDSSSKNRLELYGSKGSILAEGTIGQGQEGEMRAYLERETAGYDASQSRGGPEGLEINPEPVNMYRAEVEEFADAVLEGREPAVNANMGLRSQRVLAACYESARSGVMVTIE